MKTLRIFLLLALAVCLSGCAAANVAMTKKDLNVQTKMSQSIFMDVESGTARTIFIDVRNTTDRQDINIKNRLVAKLTARGYQIETTPANAGYILQVNVLQVGMTNPSAYESSVFDGFGSVIGATTAGAVGGAAVSGSSTGAVVGGGAFALADFVAGSLVKDVTYSMITDVMVSKRVGRKAQRERFETRIGSMANQVNLKFEDAQPVMEENLAASIAGIF